MPAEPAPDPSGVSIGLLADHDEHAAALAAWFFAEWSDYYAGTSLDALTREFESRAVGAALPLALVALREGEPVGTVSLLRESIPSHAHLTPWVGGLYVAAPARGGGIGMALVSHAVRLGASLGFDRLHVAVHSGEQAYTRAGWTVLERTRHGDEPITILVRTQTLEGSLSGTLRQ